MKVLTIIVTYNGLNWIKACLESLQEAKTDILIIDNASTDQTVNWIIKHYPDLTILLNAQNKGFGAANNQGLKIAINREVDYVFLLNQDTRVQKDTLEQLIASHRKFPQYGLISPVHLQGNGQFLDQGFKNYLQESYPGLILEKLLSQQEVIPVAFVNAAAWLLPKSTFKKIGGFDPLFFYTGEDEDYVNRLKYHKLPIGIAPLSKIYHHREERKPLSIHKKMYYYSRLADSYKTLKDINHSWGYNLIKSVYHFFNYHCAYLLSRKAFPLQLKLWKTLCTTQLQLFRHRKLSKRIGPTFLENERI